MSVLPRSFAAAAAFGLVASLAFAQCTPETINPGSVQAIRPHMSPAGVSGILGCAPTDITIAETGTVWVWAVPTPVANVQGFEYMQIGVAFDAAGAAFAGFTTALLITALPAGNGALRVDPGGWVPGAYAAP